VRTQRGRRVKIRMFYHSLVSDWNHGNAHFLRGIATELTRRGHDVAVYQPMEGWSVKNLVAAHGQKPLRKFRAIYPALKSIDYSLESLDVGAALHDADLVIVHEWNDPELVRRVGEYRGGKDFVLLFHDTHHRMVTDRESMQGYQLEHYDGVLAYGRVLRNLYVSEKLARRAWTWHEAADTRVFRPLTGRAMRGDLVWVGNWGDGERTEELREFLVEPVKALGLKARIYGVQYPEAAKASLAAAGIEYAGWLPNYEVPKVFSEFRLTVHIPRRPYVKALPGIPTIRPFEALACGIPMISSPWDDAEKLFSPGKDFLVARDGQEMKKQIETLLGSDSRRQAQVKHGLRTIRGSHTCAHRVNELLAIVRQLRSRNKPSRASH
jgi:spore maturation protein CgeB